MNEALLEAGLEHYRRGDRDEAETWLRKAVEADPDEPTAHFILGLMRFEAGDAEAAIRSLQRVVALRPDHAVAWQTLGDLRRHRGADPDAVEAYRKATQLDSKLTAGWIGLSQALLACGDADAALEAADVAAGRAPSDAAAHMTRAAALSRLGRRRAAADAYRSAADLAPDLATARVGLAVEQLQLGDAASAAASAERAVTLDPSIALGWLTLGTALRRTGDWPRACLALERSLALDPSQHAAALALGVLCAMTDQTALAQRWLQRAVELEPDDAEAHAALSSVYCADDRFELGRAHAEKALALDPTLLAPRQNLARVLVRQGLRDEAKLHLDLAYRDHSFQVAPAPHEIQRVLLLVTTDQGNTPDRYLLPADRFTRIYWCVEYADEAQTAALPDYDVVFNCIGDQDETGPTAANVARFLRSCRGPVLNHPGAIARTSRHLATSLFSGVEGLVTPRTARIAGDEIAAVGLLEVARRAGVEPPFIVRPVGSHGGEGVRLIAGSQDAAAPADGRDRYVTTFRDFRSTDGLYRKYRIVFVDRRPYPYHLAIGPRWLLHYNSGETAREPAHLAEERRFLEGPEATLGAPAMEAVREVGRRLDLDFAGLDFALLADGGVLLFEANATMLVHPEDPGGPLAHKNAFVSRIVNAFQDRLARAQV